MNLKKLLVIFFVLWLASIGSMLFLFPSLQDAGNFGDSFGGISSLFSGIALALAIYSMVLQQRQSVEFEQKTLSTLKQQIDTMKLVEGSLTQQAAAVKLIEKTLFQQANTAQVAALNALIDREEQRIDTLRQWGVMAGDGDKYINGIKAAKRKIEEYQDALKKYAAG